jgi:hypothetical protein
MLKAQGYGLITGDAKIQAEFDTISCGHCGKIVRVKPGTGSTVYVFDQIHIEPETKIATITYQEEPGAGCKLCMRSICLPCYERGNCIPMEKRLEEIEKIGRKLKQTGSDRFFSEKSFY